MKLVRHVHFIKILIVKFEHERLLHNNISEATIDYHPTPNGSQTSYLRNPGSTEEKTHKEIAADKTFNRQTDRPEEPNRTNSTSKSVENSYYIPIKENQPFE